jgi:hypothetical protein
MIQGFVGITELGEAAPNLRILLDVKINPD